MLSKLLLCEYFCHPSTHFTILSAGLMEKLSIQKKPVHTNVLRTNQARGRKGVERLINDIDNLCHPNLQKPLMSKA